MPTGALQGRIYDLAKSSAIRLAFGMAEELRAHNVAALAVTPGFLRSEAMLDLFGVTEANWQEGARVDPHFIASETPYFVGRAVAALAAFPGGDGQERRRVQFLGPVRGVRFHRRRRAAPTLGPLFRRACGRSIGVRR